MQEIRIAKCQSTQFTSFWPKNMHSLSTATTTSQTSYLKDCFMYVKTCPAHIIFQNNTNYAEIVTEMQNSNRMHDIIMYFKYVFRLVVFQLAYLTTPVVSFRPRRWCQQECTDRQWSRRRNKERSTMSPPSRCWSIPTVDYSNAECAERLASRQAL